MYVKWEGVQGEETRGGGGGGDGRGDGVKESTFPRTGMRRGGRPLWKNGTLFIYLV